jgi:hypothetical protein
MREFVLSRAAHDLAVNANNPVDVYSGVFNHEDSNQRRWLLEKESVVA